MNVSEVVVGALLAAALVALAGYYAWRQMQTLKLIREPSWSPEDRLYARKQVNRRLWCSVLMVVFAAMLVGWFFLEGAKPDAVPEQEEATPEQRQYAWQVALYWGTALLILFVIVLLAALDLVAIGRFAHRKVRQLEADRRAILERHAADYRRQGNGQA